MSSLRLSSVPSAILLVLSMAFPVYAQAHGPGPAAKQTGRVEVARQVYLMGTHCQLITYASNRATGLKRLESLLSVLEHTEAELSTWRSDSLLSRLNRHPPGQPFRLNQATCIMLEQVFRWQRASASAFDPAIAALIEVWGIRQGRQDWPSQQELEQARQRSGLALWEFEADRCEVVRRRQVKIDAGGFGKGEALDRVSDRTGVGPGSWLIDLGGQIKVSGLPPDQECWSIPIAHPLHRHEPLLTLCLSSGALATSGTSERSARVGGKRVNHILDPRSGHPAAFGGSVTVWHEQALAADILSTALFVMGPEQGLKWANEQRLAACFFVPSQDRPQGGVDVVPSALFRQKFLAEQGREWEAR